MPNPKALLDMVGGIFDVGRDVISTIKDGKEKNLDTAEIAINVAAGLITSLATNLSCLITQFFPPVGYILMGVAAIVVGLVAAYNFSQGNTGMGIAQVINLVSIVFSMFNPTCFTGDTEVYTSDGLVCIEEIQVGDSVWAYNPETGETELKEVLNVWVKETDEILHVSTSDGETIDTTTNHPFYVEDKGWVAAGDLEIGDTLITADGDEVEVTDLELEKLAEPITVYNLEVADFHTYFVGEYGVLVHNKYSGSYDIEFASGKHYVGKGSEARMEKSAQRVSKKFNDAVVNKEWCEAMNDSVAFIDEFMRMSKYDFDFYHLFKNPNSVLYNKIMSPGAKIFARWFQ